MAKGGKKQDSLTGDNDLQRQHGGKGRMTATGNGVYRTKSNVVLAVSDDVSTENDNRERGQMAGSGLVGYKERRQ